MCPGVVQQHLPVVGEQVPVVPSSMGTVMRRCQLKRHARSRMLARKTARLSASPSNLASRGAIALLYNLVAVAPVLGSSKLRMTCDRPGLNANAGGAGGCRWCREHWRSGSSGRLSRGCRRGRLGRRSRLPLVHVALRRKCCWRSTSSLCSCLYDGRSLSSRAEEACYFSTSVP